MNSVTERKRLAENWQVFQENHAKVWIQNNLVEACV
jgi:hypothetical protein